MISTKYVALQCQNCKDVIISRAHYDFNTCSCFVSEDDSLGCYIDGDSRVDSPHRDYRIGYGKLEPKIYYVTLPYSVIQIFQDWNKRIDQFARIDINLYPLENIPD